MYPSTILSLTCLILPVKAAKGREDSSYHLPIPSTKDRVTGVSLDWEQAVRAVCSVHLVVMLTDPDGP